MFNNRFNSTHKDPLVEAVRQAQQDGDLRRQAEAFVNEEFGVYSRQAVVRENLAAYDARLEEAYKCMKEGKPLDPVGKEDGDVDNDGDSDKSDKYLLNRRKAIGKSMGKRMEEGSGVSGEDPGMAVAKQAGAAQQAQTPSSTPKRTGNAAGSTISNARGATGMNEEGINEMWSDPIDPEVKAFWDKRMAKSRAEKVKAEKVKSKKKESTRKKIKEESLDEATRKHFAAHAADISKISDQGERNKAASAAADTYARLNPRFNHEKFHTAAGSTAHQAKTVKESVFAAIRAKYMKEDSSFNAALDSGKSVAEAAMAVDMMNPPAIQGPAKAGVQKAAATRPSVGARFAPLNKVAAQTTVNPVKMMPKPPVNMSAMKGPMMNMGKSMPVTSPVSAAASAAPKSLASRVAGVASNPVVGAATASYSLGQLATGTETGRAIGKSVGDNFPGLKSAMAKVKDYRDNVVAPKLGMKSLSTAADTPYISKAVKSVMPGDSKAEPTPTPKAEPSSFKQSFSAARKEAGSSQGQFTYKGKEYQTNLNPAKGAEKYIPAPQQKVTSVGKTSTAAPSTTSSTSTTPGSTSIKAQPAPPSSATAGMSSAAEKSGISQTPTKSGTEFGAGKDVSSTPMPTTSTPAEPEAKGAVSTAPEKKQKETGTTSQNVNESVQVGNYKYRIV